MGEKVTFLASFPSVMSAIKVTGDGSGMRIMLDIPETEMAEAVKLMLYRQVVLKVTIEQDKQSTHCLTTGSNNDAIPKGEERKSKWSTAEE